MTPADCHEPRRAVIRQPIVRSIVTGHWSARALPRNEVSFQIHLPGTVCAYHKPLYMGREQPKSGEPPMSVTSIWFYPLLMVAFILEGSVLSKALLFHRMQNGKELQSQRVVALDGMRGILALSVFFLHVVEYHRYEVSGLWVAPDSNFYAQLGVFPVSMFFFITGYVFWLKLIQQPTIPFWRFLYGRLGRLGGVYGLVCLLCFALAAVVSGFHRNMPVSMLAVQMASWLSFFGSGHDINHIYFSRLWLGPGWTLRYEWMFYFSVPLLGWFARRWERLPFILILAAIISVMAGRLHMKGAAELIWGMLGSYAQFLCLTFSVGMIIANVRVPARVHAWAKSGLAAGLSLILIAVTLAWAAPKFGWRESLLLAGPFACLCMGNTWFGLLTSEPIRFLGRISYSFYLLHVVLLAAELLILRRYANFNSIGPIRYWLFALASGAITIWVSAISYEHLEYPLLHIGRSTRNHERRVVSRPVCEPFGTPAKPAA